ncbi:ATP-binding protein [Couchioplanes caeruleus]|uniref:ATP-binding protein n=1 Tax=Couchioplanes caeruleus TaxID=56438 RepID=UPI0014759C33|nr:ATP-binding protein [Couchioplanes caeruleus]
MTEAFAELGRIRLADPDVDTLLVKITQLAKRSIAGASEVSITLLQGDQAHTAAVTGELARKLDERQYESGHGPCLDASVGTTILSVPDIASEDRWPDWTATARQAGVGSSLSIGLPMREEAACGLNIYATEAHAFDDDAITLAQTFAGFAAVGLANAHPHQTPATPTGHPRAATAALNSAALVESMKEAFVAVDPDGVVVEFNRAAHDLLGWPAEEVLGRHLADTVLPDYDGEPIGKALNRLFAAGARPRSVPRRVSLRHRDGRRLPAQMVLSVIRGAAGALACVFVTDLSQQTAAENDAERQRRFLATLLDNLDVGVVALGPDGTPLVVNRALRRVHGIGEDWSAAEVTQAVAESVCDLDGTPLPLSQTPLLRALRGEHVRAADVLVRMPGVPDRIFVSHAQPITTSEGTRLGAVAALHDVTAIRRAEGFRDCEQQVWQVLAAAATVGDAAPATLRAVSETLGWPHGELWLVDPLTDTLQMTGHWSTAEGQCGDLHLDPVTRGVGVIGTVWATGQPLWVPDITDTADSATEQSLVQAQTCAHTRLHTFLAVPIRDGDAVLGVLAYYCGTREQDQDLLTVLLSGVAAQFGMFVALRRSADLAEQLLRTRNDFLTLVGHELRTPLTSITSYATMLADDPTIGADEARHMLHVIARNAGSLRTIVDDLLDLSGLEAGHLQLAVTEHDLVDIVASAVAAAEPAAAANGVRLHTKLPKRLSLHGDPARLRQAVDNLLSNAITYSPHGGDVRIRLTARPEMAELRITDSGIGIPAGEHHHLFDRFYRASNVAHQGFPGAGLGLALVHAITALHRGDISFDIKHHQPGASVRLRLPRRSRTPQPRLQGRQP